KQSGTRPGESLAASIWDGVLHACSSGRPGPQCTEALLAAVAVHPICLQRVRLRHGDDVVAGIDEMDFARDAGRQIRQEIQTSSTQLLQGDASAKRRMFLLEGEHVARVGNAGASERTDRPSRYGIDPNLLRAEIDGKIPH